MYVTRPLSLYRKSPEYLSSPPPEGPNSGVLVIQDEESESTCCFGSCQDRQIREFPFPQNKNMTIRYVQSTGQSVIVFTNHVLLIPVLNKPLSSNQYYAIKTCGKHRGLVYICALQVTFCYCFLIQLSYFWLCREAYSSSKESDMRSCCFCLCAKDVKPKPLDDPYDLDQQFQFFSYGGCCGGFDAQSVVPDGFAPLFLRRRGWTISTRTPKNFQLGQAEGLDSSLRTRLPDLNFSLSRGSETVVVGKWYCPFMFIKEGLVKDQLEMSPYYQMTLEQRWEEIFSCENDGGFGNSVVVDAVVGREMVRLGEDDDEREAWCDEGDNVNGGIVWFRSGEVSVGLSVAIVEKMKWVQEKFGWNVKESKQGRLILKREEEFRGVGEWRKFGCFVLVERFVLRRMDGSLVLTYDFKHTSEIRSKWE